MLKGERRHPSKDNWFNRFLKDNISTRLYQKQINAQIQKLLEKWAEPFSTFAYLLGETYPTPYLELAWKYLLSNHPDDSITDVSMDQIHQDMRFRWDQVKQIGESLTNKAFEALVKRIDLSSIPAEDRAIVIFNPLNYERKSLKLTFRMNQKINPWKFMTPPQNRLLNFNYRIGGNGDPW